MKIKSILVFFFVTILGFTFTLLLLNYLVDKNPKSIILSPLQKQNKQHIIGFLPYWFIGKTDKDYSQYLTNITYFGLTVEGDGKIQKYTNPGEAEPGWQALNSGKFTPSKNLQNSLLIFSGDPDTINELVSEPASHAATLVSQINPIMEQYGFTDLNLDIENVLYASESARLHFTAFIKEVKSRINTTLTIDASPTDLIKSRLINLEAVEPYVDYIVLMTYDYHYPGSQVSGAVAPVGGVGIDSEFDVETGIQKALEVLPKNKIILGIPLYGYEWETLTDYPRSATLPGSGITASNKRVEEFLASCASCSAQIEANSQESYLIYYDQEYKTYHQIFYPDAQAVQEKIDLVKKYKLGGMAFWALGYEGQTILEPVKTYK
ncbi:hypothetical protein GYA49_04580 [Candidatus Beckwithbacteria bacterium]|nr:hypothetical protein [Candidatus Beckwithbacteria bacterium]